MPKVSVIVPCYNVSPYLERCLDSLVQQTLKDIEIIKRITFQKIIVSLHERIKYPELVGQNIAHDNMIKSLSVWLDTGKDFEIRITCDPRHITKLDLLEIIQDLHLRGVKKIAIQKYIPHFEDNEHGTTPEQRAQYFNDEKLREDINSKFESVIWRE